MMLKRLATACILLSTFNSAYAIDGSPTSLEFNLSGSVPYSDFYCDIVDSSNVGNSNTKANVDFVYNRTTGKFNQESVLIRCKNTDGGIAAKATSGARIDSLTSGHFIEFDMTMNGKVITDAIQPTTIFSDATVEQTARLFFNPKQNSAYEPGEYDGTVTIEFSATLPPNL